MPTTNIEGASLEDFENSVYAEVEGTTSPEGEDLKDGAEAEAIPTAEADDTVPVEDEFSDIKEDGDGADDATLSEIDDEGDGEDDAILTDEEVEEKPKTPKEKETQAQRLEAAQKKMHLATMEAAQIRKERDSLQKERDEWRRKYEETQKDIDEGKAVSSKERNAKAIAQELPDELKAMAEMNPEMLGLVQSVLDIKLKQANKSETKAEAKAEAQSGPTPQQIAWKETVETMCPAFMSDRATPEYQKFLSEKPNLVAAIANRYDDLDPKGAIVLHSNFLKYKKEQSTQKKPESSDRVRGRNVYQPTGAVDAGPRRSRASIEAEFERTLK